MYLIGKVKYCIIKIYDICKIDLIATGTSLYNGSLLCLGNILEANSSKFNTITVFYCPQEAGCVVKYIVKVSYH